MVLGQTPNILADDPTYPTMAEGGYMPPTFEPLQSGIVAEPLFSPGESFAMNALFIGGAIILAIFVMRGVRAS